MRRSMVGGGTMLAAGVRRKSLRSETGSQPPWLQGLQRRSRQPARTVPRITPSSRTASTAYAEQVGSYLQRRGRAGETKRW